MLRHLGKSSYAAQPPPKSPLTVPIQTAMRIAPIFERNPKPSQGAEIVTANRRRSSNPTRPTPFSVAAFHRHHRQDEMLLQLVLRDVHWNEEDAAVLVPGDIISIKLGDIVPADVRLLDGVHTFFGKAAHLVYSTNQVGHFQKARAGFQEVNFLPFNPTDKHTTLTNLDSEASLVFFSEVLGIIPGDQLAIGNETGRRLGMGTNMYPSSSLLGNNKDEYIAALPIDELIEKADGFAGVFPGMISFSFYHINI
ncbi:hypothetical protein ACS0TY_018074 [Phlomoides rotata]